MKSNDLARKSGSSLKQLSGISWHDVVNTSCSIAVFTDDCSVPDDALKKYLSPAEVQQAVALHDDIERRHFLARRCFQRVFVCEVMASDIPPGKLRLNHKRDSRPTCLDAPGLHLSFSSSGTTAIACASRRNPVGIDIERMRLISNTVALAQRFFGTSEAETLAALPAEEQNIHFLHYWTAKEAALKAMGKGIVYGLNTFSVERAGSGLTYKICGPSEDKADFSLQYLQLTPQYVVALVEKINVGNS